MYLNDQIAHYTPLRELVHWAQAQELPFMTPLAVLHFDQQYSEGTSPHFGVERKLSKCEVRQTVDRPAAAAVRQQQPSAAAATHTSGPSKRLPQPFSLRTES